MTFTLSTERKKEFGTPGKNDGPGRSKLMPLVPSASTCSHWNFTAANDVASQRMPAAIERCLPEIEPGSGDGGSLSECFGFVLERMAYGVTAPKRYPPMAYQPSAATRL